MDAFATVDDLEARWRPLDEDETAVAEVRLEDASVLLRSWRPGLDEAIADGELDESVPKIIVCAMVKRSMNTPPGGVDGLSSMSTTTGPFGQTMSFSNPDGNLFLTKVEKGLLGVGSGVAFGVDVTAASWEP